MVKRMQFGPLVEPSPGLSEPEQSRYARHTRLVEIGDLGQRRLAAARVLVVGAGGLGSPALTYLAAAGVGTLGIVDDDVVEVSNLHRQPLHGDRDVGRAKVDSAADRLKELNPHITVRTHGHRFTAHTARDLVAAYDLVVDGADNFATRYLVADACGLARIPHVWASINTFAGQLSVWWAGQGPCYRCVFPEAPPPGSVASCAEAGVLGVLPGVMGALQAAEAIKLITGVGEVSVIARPDCALCGDSPTITAVLGAEERPQVPTIAPRVAVGLVGLPDVVMLDVREAGELVEGRIEPSVHIPLREIVGGGASEQVASWRDRGARVVVYCRSGVRSAEAAAYLLDEGVSRVESLDGGIIAWEALDGG